MRMTLERRVVIYAGVDEHIRLSREHLMRGEMKEGLEHVDAALQMLRTLDHDLGVTYEAREVSHA